MENKEQAKAWMSAAVYDDGCKSEAHGGTFESFALLGVMTKDLLEETEKGFGKEETLKIYVATQLSVLSMIEGFDDIEKKY